ncbi:MAG: hypothetical protein JO024_01900 [Candidatus Eremiobacteraeota bacterium]|nr:hypothetical protein [Candidatus Eremiobacteraeota bacterium]
MRAIFSTSVLAILIAMSMTACANSSRTATSTQNQTTASTAPAHHAAAPPAPVAASSASGAPPLYPGAAPAHALASLGEKALPVTAKVYTTSDGFAKVKAWYKSKLNGAPEMSQPGKEATQDAFLLGHAKTAMVVLIQSVNGKTWIAIARPM